MATVGGWHYAAGCDDRTIEWEVLLQYSLSEAARAVRFNICWTSRWPRCPVSKVLDVFAQASSLSHRCYCALAEWSWKLLAPLIVLLLFILSSLTLLLAAAVINSMAKMTWNWHNAIGVTFWEGFIWGKREESLAEVCCIRGFALTASYGMYWANCIQLEVNSALTQIWCSRSRYG